MARVFHLQLLLVVELNLHRALQRVEDWCNLVVEIPLVDCVEQVDGKEGRGQQVQVYVLVFPFCGGCIVIWLDFEAVVAQIGGDSERAPSLVA